MDMEEVKQQIQQHLESAYALLPPIIEPDEPKGHRRANLQLRYESKDWNQLFNFLSAYSFQNQFSEELLFHIKAAEDLYEDHDRLGMRAILSQLTPEEKSIIGECLNAVVYGPFLLDDWEFPLIMDATREEVSQIASAWPDIPETDLTARIVINNSINNLFGYPHGKQHEWSKHISVSPQEVDVVYRKFRKLAGLAYDNEKPLSSSLFQGFK
ncbi:MAG: hypothetical protein EOP06_15440 [Proteobacteria bacterium]|nr:MAG: hypothetical protein EOP06_15440 [Pseudomonadota bacterium]